MKTYFRKSDKNSIKAIKRKEQETADASILFQKKQKIKKLVICYTENYKGISAFLRNKYKKILFFLSVLILVGGIGVCFSPALKVFQNNKTVAIRIGEIPEYIDYDLLAAVNFLKYNFERNGYKVIGTSYAGNLYPKELDNAHVNVFVRGFSQFFDLRMNKRKTNIFYVHRYTKLYVEEFQNFDFYLSSQRKLIDAVNHQDISINFLPGGFVTHDLLIPNEYQYDVLYIYEYYNQAYHSFMQQNHRIKIYSGSRFAALDEQKRIDELKKAKVIVYEMGKTDSDDESYIPYAVFDLISYGRPVITNRKLLLDMYFGDRIWLFDELNSMILTTEQALNSSDKIREKKAIQARNVLNDFFDINVPFIQKIKLKN